VHGGVTVGHERKYIPGSNVASRPGLLELQLPSFHSMEMKGDLPHGSVESVNKSFVL
jgi:hypothetical protein